MTRKITINQFQSSHALIMDFRDEIEYSFLINNNTNYFKDLEYACEGNAWTIKSNDTVVIILGFITNKIGYSDCFFFASKLLDQLFNIHIYKSLLSIMDYAISVNYRMHTLCIASDTIEGKRNRKFLQKLGFQQECLVKKLGLNAEDMYIYSIVKDVQ